MQHRACVSGNTGGSPATAPPSFTSGCERSLSSAPLRPFRRNNESSRRFASDLQIRPGQRRARVVVARELREAGVLHEGRDDAILRGIRARRRGQAPNRLEGTPLQPSNESSSQEPWPCRMQ